ncbi:hypothetical protein DFQ14_104280 [Halopolyspora algeriensis]|uniref:DUF8129 domain-containing protein n=1 Tax=Halopolyspora algeriensis TaxID=1500506 RepID=A0A368VSL7_9ACTN|nr:hypothetical protein [Halopolyspora algeriensis]RCW44689.1 hypothetical protein DFQ14_104280 [Halopolyspora algeriensis]TQM56047.1 hypothetical protein FHU43_0830 [Halopolyspora algeriensis]
MSAEDLPLPDYDHLPIGSLQHRIRSLNAGELQRVIDYEAEHNDRTHVMEILRHRMDELNNGATPSPGRQNDDAVETQGTPGDSPITPNRASEPIHPPRHGTVASPGQHNKRGRP